MLKIKKATEKDLIAIMNIYSSAQDFMIKSGNPNQWAKAYPTEELILEDISFGKCHILYEDEDIHGVFCLQQGEDPTYSFIEDGAWLNDQPYVTIHRIASDGSGKGVFSKASNYCKEHFNNVRIDTHGDNLPMQKQIKTAGFKKCGTIYVEDGSPRIAFQWEKE